MSRSRHLTVRVDENTIELVDALGREWGVLKDDGDVNRSEVIRLLIDSYGGVLDGRFLALVDDDLLVEEWGCAGAVLAAAETTDEGPLDGMKDARLADVLKPLPSLVGAGRVATGREPNISGDDAGGG